MPASQSNDFIKAILTNDDGTTKIETENPSTLPTQEEVRKEEEWKTSIEAARKKETDHAGKSWTACYNDECLVHMSDKDAEGWFPKQPRQQPATAPHADLPRVKCNRWGCQIPAHQPGKSSKTNTARKRGKSSEKPQNEWLSDRDSTVPDTTKSLQTELMKLIKEQWELEEELKEQQVVIEQLKQDLNKERFEVTRQRGLTTIAQQTAGGAMLKNLEFHKKLSEIHEALKTPEQVWEDEIFIASMTWRTAWWDPGMEKGELVSRFSRSWLYFLCYFLHVAQLATT